MGLLLLCWEYQLSSETRKTGLRGSDMEVGSQQISLFTERNKKKKTTKNTRQTTAVTKRLNAFTESHKERQD